MRRDHIGMDLNFSGITYQWPRLTISDLHHRIASIKISINLKLLIWTGGYANLKGHYQENAEGKI